MFILTIVRILRGWPLEADESPTPPSAVPPVPPQNVDLPNPMSDELMNSLPVHANHIQLNDSPIFKLGTVSRARGVNRVFKPSGNNVGSDTTLTFNAL